MKTKKKKQSASRDLERKMSKGKNDMIKMEYKITLIKE